VLAWFDEFRFFCRDENGKIMNEQEISPDGGDSILVPRVYEPLDCETRP
jgi:hypothetical protein